MLEYFGSAFAVKLVKALVACVGLVLFSKWLDLRSKIDFGEFFRDLKNDPKAAADYLGKRFIGMAIVISMALLVACSPAEKASEAPVDKARHSSDSVAPPPAQPSIPRKASRFPTTYDGPIAVAVQTWWLDYPHPPAWKAQLWQESRLKPDAVSPVGASGLAQFMPGTWDQVLKQMGKAGVSPFDAYQAIDAGAFYMLKLRKQWSSPRPQDDRQRLAQASYNAGLGSILKAQKACNGAALWADIKICLPQVTGRHSKETIDYVELIARWRGEMERGV